VIVGIGDDAAVTRISPGYDLVSTTDAMVEGIHFLRETLSPYDLGWKSMAANLSDVAAMGAVPRFALVALAISPQWDLPGLLDIYRGMGDLAKRYGVVIIGGNVTRSPHDLMITVTMLGEVEPGKALRRSGARYGDCLFVTGPLGLSAAGLALLKEGRAAFVPDDVGRVLTTAHQRPLPQIEAGRLLLSEGCTALNDVSDGLASELFEIAEASGVSLRVKAAGLWVEPAMAELAKLQGLSVWPWILYGGEDYQLVGTVPAIRKHHVEAAFRKNGLALFWIGEAEKPGVRPQVLLDWGDRQELLEKRGYNHFWRG